MLDIVENLANFLKNNDCFCFLCHKDADGDSLGGAYALFYAMQQLGKKSIVKTYEDEYFESFKFLYPTPYDKKEEKFNVQYYVAVDVSTRNLLDETMKEKEIYAVIDHHNSNDIKAKVCCVDESACATCELIYLILKDLEIEITQKIADCLYTGISTDTGCFKYSNVTARTHRIAAELIEKGANFSLINFEMFDKKTKQRIDLEKNILENLEYYFNGGCVIVFITKEIMEKTKAKKEDYMSVAYIAACVDTAYISITARQEEEFLYKISVRTKGDLDASRFCRIFGGGGHKKAAGCSMVGDLDSVRNKILETLKKEDLLKLL